MLDIIITHYNEPWFVCKKLFMTLDMQRIVNWDEITVMVINDGGYRLPKEELDRLSFHVFQIDIPKSGVSVARNTGFQLGTEPWIMFCDCDDSFTNIYALDEIMSAIRTSDADVMWTNCLTELGRFISPLADERHVIFIHGKVYRRGFLIDSGIRFDESLTYGEDTKFNEEIAERTDRIRELPTRMPPYVWIRRGGSVTTKEG